MSFWPFLSPLKAGINTPVWKTPPVTEWPCLHTGSIPLGLTCVLCCLCWVILALYLLQKNVVCSLKYTGWPMLKALTFKGIVLFPSHRDFVLKNVAKQRITFVSLEVYRNLNTVTWPWWTDTRTKDSDTEKFETTNRILSSFSKRCLNTNPRRLVLWDPTPSFSWSAGFPNKAAISCSNNSSLNLLDCHLTGSLGLDSLTLTPTDLGPRFKLRQKWSTWNIL